MSILHNTDKLFDEKYQSLKEKLQDAHHELYHYQDELEDALSDIEDESDRSNDEYAITRIIDDKERQLEESESAINEHKEFVEYFDTMLKEQKEVEKQQMQLQKDVQRQRNAEHKAYLLSQKVSS
jgi:hypothetical protein